MANWILLICKHSVGRRILIDLVLPAFLVALCTTARPSEDTAQSPQAIAVMVSAKGNDLDSCPVWSYEARNSVGETKVGLISAPTEASAVDTLRKRGLVVLPPLRRQLSEAERENKEASRRIAVAMPDYVKFFQGLSELLDAHVPLREAIHRLEASSRPRSVIERAKVLGAALDSRKSLGESLRSNGKWFAEETIDLCDAAEIGNILAEAIRLHAQRLAAMQELTESDGRLSWTFARAEATILSVALIAVLIVLRWESRFRIAHYQLQSLKSKQMFEFVETPELFTLKYVFTNPIQSAARCLHLAPTTVFVAVVSLTTASIYLFHTFVEPIRRQRLDTQCYDVLSTMSETYAQGVPILRVIDVSFRKSDELTLQQATERVYNEIREGQELSGVLCKLGVFTEYELGLIADSKETGRVDEMLTEAANVRRKSHDEHEASLTKRGNWANGIALFAGIILVGACAALSRSRGLKSNVDLKTLPRPRVPEAGQEHPSCILLLVHGTFAPRAPWTDHDSLLNKTIIEVLPPSVLQVRFVWSGRNSHTARVRASERLAGGILDLRAKFPSTPLLCIAHSHGGNVVLYALRSDDVRRSVTAVACLASPFLNASARAFKHVARLLSITSAILFTAVWLIALFLAEALAYISNEQLFSHGVVNWTAGLVAVVLLILYFLFRAWLIQYLLRRQGRLLAMLRLPEVTSLPFFLTRAGFDEASIVLKAMTILTDLPAHPRFSGDFAVGLLRSAGVGHLDHS